MYYVIITERLSCTFNYRAQQFYEGYLFSLYEEISIEIESQFVLKSIIRNNEMKLTLIVGAAFIVGCLAVEKRRDDKVSGKIL